MEPTTRNLLESAASGDLLNFLEDYAGHDQKFENALRVRFAAPDFDAERKKISASVDALLADVSDWDTHDSWGAVSIDTRDILFEVEQRVKLGHIKLAFAVLEILYTKLLENFEFQGECELAMEAEYCLNLMAGVAEKATNADDQMYIFGRCIALADMDAGKSYGAGYEDKLLAIATNFVTRESQGQLEEAIARYEAGRQAEAFALIRLDITRKLGMQ